MGFYNNNNSSERVKKQSFVDWAIENRSLIKDRLVDEGIAFINDNAESLRQPVYHLILDDRWHYLDKPTKKQSYKGRLETNSEGVPYLSLAFYTFRHGGQSVRFNSKDALKNLWQDTRGRRVLPSTTKPVQKPTPAPQEPKVCSIDWVSRDLGHWQTMAPTGLSHYLKRKGLGDLFIPGIRHGKHHIAISITNTQGTFQGLQRIFKEASP